MWTKGRTLHPCRDFVCAPLPSLGVCREHIPPATKQEKKKSASHLTANRAVTLFNKSPSLTHEAVSKNHHIFLTKPLSAGLSCPWSNCVFWICYQIWGWNRIFPNGSRRMQWRYRSVRHQPFLLPPSPVWNRHLGMRNWCTPTHAIIKEHALLNEVVQRVNIFAAQNRFCCCRFCLFLFFNTLFLTDSISLLCPVQSLCLDNNLLHQRWRETDANSWRCFSTCTLMNTSVSEVRDVKWQRCTLT